ncbi:MAG TPA: RNA methyltransferase [Verrucomicrobiales bacterium]|nr:RNA methyltransferase [Verrucomicrobiales bacterium]
MSLPNEPRRRRADDPEWDARLRRVAVKVLRLCDREHPADAVLRGVLAEERGLSRSEGGEVAQMVFNFHRWRGWLGDDQATADLDSGVREANRLEARHSRSPSSFTDEELIQRSVPPWVVSEVEVTPSWARSLQSPPRLWLRARHGKRDALARTLYDVVPGATQLCPDALEYQGQTDLHRTPEFQSGEFEIQDLSSQAVGHLCAPAPGESWWDACAGEGGKTLHLSDLMGNKGMLWASDRASWRLKKLKQRAARARVFNYRAAPWEGGVRLPTKTLFHGVLVDAPCSGIGTWQRNPHARWSTLPADVQELAAIQLQLLCNAAAALRPGGRLVYSVCTLARAETTGVASAFEARMPGMRPSNLPVTLDLAAASPAPHQLWLRPGDFPGNGMFVSAWVKAS